jgi:hypothetical protein
MSRKPSPVPSAAERLAEAIAGVESALKEGDEVKAREALIELGRTAWNLAPQLKAGLDRMTEKGPEH